MITTNYTTISPAYGRDYKNKRDVEKAFRSGKDFKMESIGMSGTYCSIKDFARGVRVNVRYGKLMRVTTLEV